MRRQGLLAGVLLMVGRKLPSPYVANGFVNAVCVDTEPKVCERVMGGDVPYRPDLFAHTQPGAANNFALGEVHAPACAE